MTLFAFGWQCFKEALCRSSDMQARTAESDLGLKF